MIIKSKILGLFFFALAISLPACKKLNMEKRTFSSSFEAVSDFDGFYLTPQGHKNTSYHELSDSIVHSGTYAHKAWITGANTPSIVTNNNHRAYPTIQLHKTTEGSFASPCYITLWVWLDMDLQPNPSGDDDWFSFATITDDESDNWARTLLVNLSHDGFVHLMHTTGQGQQNHIFQTSTITFPQKEWVELKIFIDSANEHYAKVWQNGQLVSHAEIGNMQNRLAQAHFGMYCPPSISSGVVYNDDLVIEMVDSE